VDIPGVASRPESTSGRLAGSSDPSAKAWLGIWYRCCHTYGRLYKDAAGRMYVGRCPKCGAEARARVGSGGTNRRLFEAH
jgi:hypothetical protein